MIRLAALLCCLALPLRAEPAQRLQAAFQTWLDARGAQGVIAVWHHGKEHAVTGHGLDPHAPQDLASLSKAITATCAMTLVSDGTWTEQTTAAEVLDRPAPASATVGALITHTAGLGPDATQGWRVGLVPLARLAAPSVHSDALDRGANPDGIGAFAYNNENYAVLGAMIAAETGLSYQEACQNRVLTPAGVTGTISDRFGPMAPWGGWAMRVSDYAQFMHHWYYAPPANLRAGPRHHFEGQGHWYGTGMYVRPWWQSHNVWHTGGYCFPAQVNLGTFAVSWRGEWSAVVAYDLCASWADINALDQAFIAAVFGE